MESPPTAAVSPSAPVMPPQSEASPSQENWVSKTKNMKSIAEFQPGFEVVNGVAKVQIPVEVVDESVPLWKCFVVGYFMGDARHVGTIHSTVNRIWTVTEKSVRIDVQFINKSTLLFRVDSPRIREHVLKRRYWHIANVPLVLGEWTPETAQAPPDLSAMPLWVDMKNVPAHLFSHEGLSFLASTSGNFVKLHPNTERCIRLDVARALVEVNLKKPLVEQICFMDTNGEEVNVSVSYPWLPPRCSICSKWGHTGKDCTQKVTILLDENQVRKRTEMTISSQQQGPVVSVQELANELLKDLASTTPLRTEAELEKTEQVSSGDKRTETMPGKELNEAGI